MKNSEPARFSQYSSNFDFTYLLDVTFPKLVRTNSRIHGKGIQTQQFIKTGAVICPLYGFLYNIHKAKINYPKYSYQISDTIAIETANEPGYFNHSCEPNAFLNADWLFEAVRDIQEGEEITLDYATVDFFDYTFDCSCETLTCRGKFTGTFSADTKYQQKMGKYFSPYLQNKFLR